MSSDKNYGTVATKQASAILTAAYGTESAGWTTKGIDVSMYDLVSLEITYHHQDTATLLSMQPMAGERTAADLDDYVPMMREPSADGVLSDLELTWDVSGLTDDTDNVRQLPPIDVRGVSMLRLAAKADNVADSPTLAVRYMGHRTNQASAQLAADDVA